MISISRLLLVLLPVSCGAIRSFVPKPDLPKGISLEDPNNQWISLNERVEFLRASDDAELARRFLSSNGGSQSPYSTQVFVDGDQEYDEYQQAWRYLGFMIDCDASLDDDANGGSGSWDGGTGEGCARYVLWAAYVDLDYQGGGIGEYQYWDHNKQKWDTNACRYRDAGGSQDNDDNKDDNNGLGRCAKMDCHLEDTHFSLLGLFKHRSYDDWMEQLFKHEGVCIWTQDEYAFMKNARKGWPQGCTPANVQSSRGEDIYYDLKPLHGGDITIGLYTDTRCTESYVSRGWNDPITLENVVGNILSKEPSHDSGDYGFVSYSTLTESLAAWDSAFDIFKTCHPCVAHDLNNYGWNTDDDSNKGSSYSTYANYKNQDDYANDDGNKQNYDWGNFDCYDDADYTNVNQCMKFMAKTYINAATYRDISLAMNQGSLVDQPITTIKGASTSTAYMTRQGQRSFLTILFFVVSCFILLLGARYFYRVRKKARNTPIFKELKEPFFA